MPRPKDDMPPDGMQDLSVSERNRKLDHAKSDAEWQDEQGAERVKKPTSSHEDKGWRALKPF